jgi:hypothetical protein
MSESQEKKQLGIKESLEMIAGIELASVSVIEIGKDGLGADDIPKGLELIQKSNVLIEAVKGFDMIDDEMKELDQAELIQLGAASYEMIKKIIKATK